jgi:hypothetical protein
MNSYVDSGEQLVVALYVRNMKESSEFYQSYGFEVVRDEGTFMELKWEDSRLFLSAVPGTPPPPAMPIGNMRVMVPDVDEYWTLAMALGIMVSIAHPTFLCSVYCAPATNSCYRTTL